MDALLDSMFLHTKTSRIMETKIKGGWKRAFRNLRPWGQKPVPENQDLSNHPRIILTEFYRVKNLGRAAGSIDRAEIWLHEYTRQSEEQLAEWEAYLSANETAETKVRNEGRKKQTEKQKVASARKTLAKARREVSWLVLAKKLENVGNRLHTFHLKLKAKFHRSQQSHGQPQNMVEGPLRPKLDGFIEKAPNKLRPLRASWQGKRSPGSQPLTSSNAHFEDGFVSRYEVPNPAMDKLRKDKHFGKHFVSPGRESRLRESVMRV
jgi:hypothetical protein